jgi:hypothetical protein
MYHTIVKNSIVAAYHNLNQGRLEPVLSAFAPTAGHYFIGQHALSGFRNTPASIAQWYDRLLTVFPDIRFVIDRLTVSGTPWNTTVIVEWTETNSGTDGVVTTNVGVNIFSIKWGRVRSLRIYTDTIILVKALERLRASGNRAASLPAIEDQLFTNRALPNGGS